MKATSKKLHWSEILVNGRTKRRRSTIQLRQAMLDYGLPLLCGCCKCPPEWQSKPLVLQIDHIDGDFLNNEPDNLRFICPNCHSQTYTFGSKNRNRLTGEQVDDLYSWSGDEYEESYDEPDWG